MATKTSLNSYSHWFFLTLTPDVGGYVAKNKELIFDTESQNFAAYTPTRIEKAGDMLLSPLTGLPRFVGYLKNNPMARVIAVATVLVVGLFFCVYPVMLKGLVVKGFSYVITSVNFKHEYIKIAGVVFGTYLITGWTVRAYGRFENKAFDKSFDRPPKPLPEVPPKKADT